MSTILKHRRGTTAQHASFTGAVGEITVDTDKDTAVVHDGTTVGGFPLLAKTMTDGTANGVAYLNGSKVLTTGSALTFDGTNLGVGGTSGYETANRTTIAAAGVNSALLGFKVGGTSAGYAFADASHVEFGAPTGRYLSWDINGEQMRLTSTGLGIGTSSPGAKLHASSGAAARSGLFQSATTGAGIEFLDSTTTTNPGIYGIGNSTTFWNNGDERMRLDSSGNLGLGVTPSAWGSAWKAFDFNNRGGLACGFDETDLNNNVYRTNTGAYIYKQTAAATTYNQSGGAHIWLTAPSGTAGDAISFSQVMTLDASGNLGLGSTSVTNYSGYKHLSVGGASKGILTLTNASNVEKMYLQVIDDSTVKIDTNTGVALAFSTQGSERARIDSSGNLLVGTTSRGTAQNSNSFDFDVTDGCSYQNHVSGTPSGNYYNAFGLGTSTIIGSITQNGTTGVLYNTTSDQRLKENIQDAAPASALIDSLQVRQYDWKVDGSHQRYGFVAQELLTVAPEAVHQPADPEEMMAVDYSKLVPMLVKEIQSLRARLAAANI